MLGAYAYMGPKAGRDVFALKPETADLAFGAITVLTGVLGTVRVPRHSRVPGGCSAAPGTWCTPCVAAVWQLPPLPA